LRSLLSVVLLALSMAAPAHAQDSEQQNVPSPPGAGMVLGRVVDAASSAPLAGVQVRMSALQRSVLTDADGVFSVRGLKAGDHTVLVSRIGYRTLVSVWRVGTEGLELEVRLEPEPLVLEAIQVHSRRFERRLRSSATNVRGFSADELRMSAHPDARSFVRSRMALASSSCGSLARPSDGPQDCVLVRGGPVRTCVIVDERPAFGGWSELELYRPQELFRVDVLGGGRVVQVYTTHYVARMSRGKWTPTSADLLSMIACPGS
jgi:hypothetical protein